MSRVSGLSRPFLLGFSAVERAQSLTTGYPPHNIERLRNHGGEDEILRIVLAVAGFAEDDLEVATEEGQLVIRGRQKEEEAPRTYLHRGIAARQFQKTFLLAEGVEILGADLKDGLLSIDLVRREAKPSVRKIAIAGGPRLAAVKQGGAS
ncbi:MAG: Hsp20 family protein [Bauldia sp.]|nr:Hsp20 family protein [Bauldia sp.]